MEKAVLSSAGPLVIVGTCIALAVFGTQACTLGSDTYITQEPGVTSGDGGAAGSTAPPSGDSTNGGPAGGSGDACKREFVKVDLAKLTACGDGKGHCYDKAKTPGAEVYVACPNGTDVCVPDEVLQAAGARLKECKSVIGPGGCITSALLPELEKQAAGQLKPDVCGAGQLCVPCIDPTNNDAPTPFCLPAGVYDKACEGTPGGPAGDAGAPPTPMPACCTTKGVSNGVCLKETVIPEAQRGSAPADTCATGTLCVPKALVEGKPVKCKAGTILGAGVCMDGCFNSMLDLAGSIGFLDRDVCGETESCVPCSFLSGQGVPGCE